MNKTIQFVNHVATPVRAVGNVAHNVFMKVVVLEKKHSHYIVGIFIMWGGVMIAQLGTVYHLPHLLHTGFDVLGFGIHGLGAMPFVEPLHAKIFRNKQVSHD